MQNIADMTSFIIAIVSLGVPEEYEVDWLTKRKFHSHLPNKYLSY